MSSRAAEAARRARHAQRTPLPRGIGNPTVEILKAELARSKNVGYAASNATGAEGKETQ